MSAFNHPHDGCVVAERACQSPSIFTPGKHPIPHRQPHSDARPLSKHSSNAALPASTTISPVQGTSIYTLPSGFYNLTSCRWAALAAAFRATSHSMPTTPHLIFYLSHTISRTSSRVVYLLRLLFLCPSSVCSALSFILRTEHDILTSLHMHDIFQYGSANRGRLQWASELVALVIPHTLLP